jgi:hypothetical protein
MPVRLDTSRACQSSARHPEHTTRSRVEASPADGQLIRLLYCSLGVLHPLLFLPLGYKWSSQHCIFAPRVAALISRVGNRDLSF